MVIFGGGGDLTKRLVTPALYNLTCTHLLPDNFAILAVDRTDQTDESYRAYLTKMMESFVGGTGEFDPRQNRRQHMVLARDRIYYLKGDLQDPQTYDVLRDRLAGFETDHNTGGNVLFYLAVGG